MIETVKDERNKLVDIGLNYAKHSFSNMGPVRMPVFRRLVLIVLVSLFPLFIIANFTLLSFPVPMNTVQIPTIYFITPTFKRREQMADLTRLAQTLMHDPNLCWILIEDGLEKSPLIADLLTRKGIRAVHMCGDTNVTGIVSELRMKGVRWVQQNGDDNGVLHFGDDDNTYDTEIFEEMRSIKKVGMWPVGLMDNTGLSTPIVRQGKCIGFYDPFLARTFCVDMAVFAVNVRFLKERPKVSMSNAIGYQEESFLKSLAPFEPSEIEPKANNCERVLVWHTQTIEKKWHRSINKFLISPQGLDFENDTNLIKLQRIM